MDELYLYSIYNTAEIRQIAYFLGDGCNCSERHQIQDKLLDLSITSMRGCES